MGPEIEQGLISFDVKPSIKLTKGQRGAYGWEIRIIGLDVDEIVRINNLMIEKFAGIE